MAIGVTRLICLLFLNLVMVTGRRATSLRYCCLANSVFTHFCSLQNVADFRLAWVAGRNWTVTDSSRLD